MWGRICDAISILRFGWVSADPETLTIATLDNGKSFLGCLSYRGSMTIIGPLDDPSRLTIKTPTKSS